jgi:hypothetical protein
VGNDSAGARGLRAAGGHAGASASGASASGLPRAQGYLPPGRQIFAGVADEPISTYVSAVGKHPAVYQEFVAWGQYLPGITNDALAAHARSMMAITTAYGSREAITPGGIAAGGGDAWLIGLGSAIAQSNNITYVRLMAEMDGNWNPYCAYNANGTRRDAAHSTASYRRAWKRVTLILRGGSVAAIDQELRRLKMPRLRTSAATLPQGKVAMLWVPQVAGAPDVPGNSPRAYWPGRQWVDWVGTDFYSKFPNFSGLNAFYAAFRHKPFVFGEYALWGADDPGFINSLFGWVSSHARARMLIYNQGAISDGPFRLYRYPRGAAALRHWLGGSRFPAYAPEFGG